MKQKADNRLQHLKRRLLMLRLASMSCTLGPIFAILVANWTEYVKTAADAVKLTVGGLMMAVVLVVTALGKLGVPRRIVVEVVLLLLAYFLQPVLSDLVMILTVTIAGEAMDIICFKRAIRATSEAIMIEKTSGGAADKTAQRVEEIVKTYFGGRV